MAAVWSRGGGVQEQIDASVDDAVRSARSRLPKGESLTHCDACGEPIPEACRKALTGVRSCLRCQTAHEEKQTAHPGFNRRGSKDSPLT
ncbi:MAG: DksA/TraR family C4-type zinc finger protein [Desulfobacterales bacterium]